MGMQIFDWYLALTPLFSILIILTLISLKLSLRKQPDISQYNIQQVKSQQKKQTNTSAVKQNVKQQSIWETSTYLKTFSYLVRNHTFLEICMTKKSKNKLPMLASITIIGLLGLFFPGVYFLCIAGLILVIVYVVAMSFFERDPADFMEAQREEFEQIRSSVKNDQNLEQNKKYMYLALAAVSCGSSLYVCGSVFQNYMNSELMLFALTFIINVGLDLVLVKPIGFLIASLGLKFHMRTQHLIQNQNLRILIQNLPPKISALELATNLSPRKKQANSPTKVPKAILGLNRKQSSENQGLMNALDSLKKIKKEKNQVGLITPVGKNNKVCDDNSHALQQYSLNQLFNDNDKSLTSNHLQQTPIAHFNIEESSCNQSRVRGKRRDSELIILQFKKNDEGQQKQSSDPETLRHNPPNFLHSNLDDEDISDITRNRNEGSESDNPADNLKIIRLLEKKSNYQASDDENDSIRNDNFMTVQQKNTGLMCINEHGDQQKQIEEIDLNSPQKRRSHIRSMLEDDVPQKKKKIKYNNSKANKRVIKFTSGEPYLEYLPNMLNKETHKHTKRSQPISFKSEFQIFEEKPARKSLKKIKKQPKINFGNNNQNECPQTMYIQDL